MRTAPLSYYAAASAIYGGAAVLIVQAMWDVARSSWRRWRFKKSVDAYPRRSAIEWEPSRLKYRRSTMGFSYADLKGDKPWEPQHNGVDTSRAAARSVRSTAGKQMELVLSLIKAAGPHGRTTDEVEEMTGGKHQAISARFNDLHKAGLIYSNEDRTDRRPTRSGRSARIYRAIEFKHPALKVVGAE